jgi:hypothetical protein
MVVRHFRPFVCGLVAWLLLAGCVSPASETTAAQSPTATPATVAPTEIAEAVPSATVTANATPAPPATPIPRRPGTEPYAGYGAWVDVFDWAPTYASSGGPAVTPDDLADMAAQGVRTIYFQTSRIDEVGAGVIQNPPLVGQFLAQAHSLDLAVVGWFLPKWEDAEDDLARLVAIAEFEADGHRFDGIAVDIEGVPTPDQRADWNRRLIELSEQLRTHLGDRAMGAIVLPPTLLEVVNPDYWPDFPWAELAPLYDVWLPMSYWSFRKDDSVFANGYSYNADASRRLRSNLGDDQALIHAIGGIGASSTDVEAGEPLAGVDELADFVRSAVETDAIGLSIYDWASQDDLGRTTMAALVAELALD